MRNEGSLRIGPAGLGSVKEACETLERYHKLGFRACEIAFTYGVYIKNKEDTEKIGRKAKELDISLSIHGPYYINLNSGKNETIEASKKRIIDCCEIGEILGASRVVFHPGYYGDNKEDSLNVISENVREILKHIKEKKWKIKIAPETMGRVNVFGGLQEIRGVVDASGCGYCIDFAHLLARDKKVDYERVKEMFPEKEWHVHFSGIEYGEKGEKNHKKTEKDEWKVLLENLPRDKDITIINESPSMMDDCVEGLKIARQMNLV